MVNYKLYSEENQVFFVFTPFFIRQCSKGERPILPSQKCCLRATPSSVNADDLQACPFFLLSWGQDPSHDHPKGDNW